MTWLCDNSSKIPASEKPPPEDEEEEPSKPPAEPTPQVEPVCVSDSNESTDEQADDFEVVGTATYKSPADFQSKADYAQFVKDNIVVGMSVECCESHDNIKVGDQGKVVKVSHTPPATSDRDTER